MNGRRASPCGGVSAVLLPRSESSAKAPEDAAADWRADSYSPRHARALCQCFFQQPGTLNSAGRKFPTQKPPSAPRRRRTSEAHAHVGAFQRQPLRRSLWHPDADRTARESVEHASGAGGDFLVTGEALARFGGHLMS